MSSWNDVHVGMHHGLAGRFAVVDADVETVRSQPGRQLRSNLRDETPEVCLLGLG